MLARVGEVIAELKNNPPPLPVDEIAEAIQFLQWLLANNFTFLGLRDYKLAATRSEPYLDSALGIMRSREMRVLRRGTELLEFTPEIMAFLQEPRPLIIAKANMRSRVHRRVYLDYIGVKRFDAGGNLIGEFRIVGLFTSTAYTRTAHSIPYLRRKIAEVEARAGFDPDSHSGKALANVLEHYPRDELFQIDEDTLYRFALAILQLDERPRVRVLARRDRFDRFVSVLVFVPRERYDSDVRGTIGDYLASAFVGRVSRLLSVLPGRPAGARALHHRPLRRATPQIRPRHAGSRGRRHRAHLDRRLDARRCWRKASGRRRTICSSAIAAPSPQAIHEAYTPADRGRRHPRHRGPDARSARSASISTTATCETSSSVGLKVWSFGRPLPLSERVPVLENMGFRVVDERTYLIQPDAEGADSLVPRHAAGAPRRRRHRSRPRQAAARSRVPDGDARRRRERRLQRARPRRRA